MHGNNILHTTTTTGTGSLTLANVTGFATFASQFAAGEVFKYAIRDATTKAMIEAGLGYLDGSGLLVRSVIHSKFDSGVYTGAAPSAVTLAAGSKEVTCASTAGGVLSAAPGVWNTTIKGYGDAHIVAAGSTLVVTANRAYAIPFVADVDSDIDALVVRITSAGGAGTLIRGAVFSWGTDGLPGVLLAQSATQAADTTGNKALTFTRFRPPPRFFACVLSDGTPVLTAVSTGVTTRATMGFDSALIPIAFIHHVGATSLTFPAPWTPVGNASNTLRPIIVARCP